ncbi:MAG: hypothetical protein HY981_03090 [Candidatus Magasanikbacteria bacterium]|nr:hypothetical protein [Candidatus Magasanikbacteria bacterium]
MRASVMTKKKQNNLILDGFNALIKSIGREKTFKFISFIKTDFVDSVELIHKMWKGKTVVEIGKEIQNAKKHGLI